VQCKKPLSAHEHAPEYGTNTRRWCRPQRRGTIQASTVEVNEVLKRLSGSARDMARVLEHGHGTIHRAPLLSKWRPAATELRHWLENTAAITEIVREDRHVYREIVEEPLRINKVHSDHRRAAKHLIATVTGRACAGSGRGVVGGPTFPSTFPSGRPFS
jgi:hypothetical protein